MRAMTEDEKELGAIIIRAQAKQYGDEETLSTVAERAYQLGRETGQRETASLRHAALFAAGIHGGPGAWRWRSDPQGTTLDDTEAWERLLGEMREWAWWEQNPQEPAASEGPAWAMGYTDSTGTVVVECCERTFESKFDAAAYLADDAPMGLWYWEGTIRGWQCPEGDYDSDAVGKFSLTTAKCVGERAAPDEFPIAEEP